VANRAAQKALYGCDLIGPAENNRAKYLSYRRMRPDPAKEDFNPFLVVNHDKKPLKADKNFKCPGLAKEGYMNE
jgi:hypothetical protein